MLLMALGGQGSVLVKIHEIALGLIENTETNSNSNKFKLIKDRQNCTACIVVSRDINRNLTLGILS